RAHRDCVHSSLRRLPQPPRVREPRPLQLAHWTEPWIAAPFTYRLCYASARHTAIDFLHSDDANFAPSSSWARLDRHSVELMLSFSSRSWRTHPLAPVLRLKEEVTLFNKVCSGSKQWAGFAVQETYTDKEVK